MNILGYEIVFPDGDTVERMGYGDVQVGGTSFTLGKEVIDMVRAFTQRIEGEDGRISTARMAARAIAEQNFADMVMDYGEGCTSGKIEFLESCGLPVPTSEYQITVYVTMQGDRDANQESLSEIERLFDSDVRNADNVTDFTIGDFEEV